jgi:hypothetical protein
LAALAAGLVVGAGGVALSWSVAPGLGFPGDAGTAWFRVSLAGFVLFIGVLQAAQRERRRAWSWERLAVDG